MCEGNCVCQDVPRPEITAYRSSTGTRVRHETVSSLMKIQECDSVLICCHVVDHFCPKSSETESNSLC